MPTAIDTNHRPELVITVVPTFSPAIASRLPNSTRALRSLGPVRAVVNSAAAREATRSTDLQTIEADRNLGFGGAANLVASEERGETDGLMILNDDAEFEEASIPVVRDHVARVGRDGILLFGSTDEPLGPPGVLGVLARVSGLWALRRILPACVRGRALPFYAAYVGWDAWDRLGGFDTQHYPLYFEDSDLLRRAIGSSTRVEIVPIPVNHERSATSRAYPETVSLLAYGGANYLHQHCGMRPQVAHGVVRAALAVRIVTEAVRRRSGSVAEARRLVINGLDAEPALPPYQ